MPASSPIPWFDEFVGIAYRYYDLRMNVVPLFTDRKEAAFLWHDTIHPWVDPSIKIRFLEIDDKYWFVMGSDTQKPDTNLSFFKELPKSESYMRFKKGHDGAAYLRLGVYSHQSLVNAKKDDVCNCSHEAQDHDEGDGDVCLFNKCDCKKFSSFQVNFLKKKKIITDIKFLKEENVKDDPLVWNCLNTNKFSKPNVTEQQFEPNFDEYSQKPRMDTAKPPTPDNLVLGALDRGSKTFESIQKNTGLDNQELDSILDDLEKNGMLKVIHKQGLFGSKIELHLTEKGFKEY